jgi:hypothetical protein
VPDHLGFYTFNSEKDPLLELSKRSGQASYLLYYFADLNAQSLLVEPTYFDRDYLAEFSAFYSTSAKGYSNCCRRIHYFATKLDRALFRRALGGSAKAVKRLQESYLGFVVYRPIPAAPLGRTVVRWYPEHSPHTPRVTYPSRDYQCHIAGLTLSVKGLAWQQQDTGVGACATIALWTMLHSSALDEHHAIPTTADITRYAHRTASLGQRIFPSTGLTLYQLCEAVKEAGLAPVVSQGDLDLGEHAGFSKDRFSSIAALLIRSGYPILLAGKLEGVGHHAVCAVGFREASPPIPKAGKLELQDGTTDYLYIHDDNLGPNVRFRIETVKAGLGEEYVQLVASTPKPQHSETLALPKNPTTDYPVFIPTQILAAVHNDLRTSPDDLYKVGLSTSQFFLAAFNKLMASKNPIGLSLSVQLLQRHRYIDEELGKMLASNPTLLAKVRLNLYEKMPRLSFHIGLLRIGWGSTPVLDILYDTTDSNSHLSVFGYVAYQQPFGLVADLLTEKGFLHLGIGIDAF